MIKKIMISVVFCTMTTSVCVQAMARKIATAVAVIAARPFIDEQQKHMNKKVTGIQQSICWNGNDAYSQTKQQISQSVKPAASIFVAQAARCDGKCVEEDEDTSDKTIEARFEEEIKTAIDNDDAPYVWIRNSKNRGKQSFNSWEFFSRATKHWVPIPGVWIKHCWEQKERSNAVSMEVDQQEHEGQQQEDVTSPWDFIGCPAPHACVQAKAHKKEATPSENSKAWESWVGVPVPGVWIKHYWEQKEIAQQEHDAQQQEGVTSPWDFIGCPAPYACVQAKASIVVKDHKK